MRRLKNPRNYISPADAAAFLRETAAEIERKTDWVSAHVNLYFASEQEVKAAMSKKVAAR